MKFVASQGGPKVPENTVVSAIVGIGPRSEGGFGLEVELDVSLPGLPHDEAEQLIEKADKVCPLFQRFARQRPGHPQARLSRAHFTLTAAVFAAVRFSGD